MTDEQIKQAAYEYINSDAVRPENIQLAFGDFIAGAHSRDEEIAYLTYRLNDVTEKLQTVIAERDNLRNPWISVKERLPEENPDDKGYSVKVIGMFANSYISDCFCSLEENIWFIDGLTCDQPTYWMSIPELKKGE